MSGPVEAHDKKGVSQDCSSDDGPDRRPRGWKLPNAWFALERVAEHSRRHTVREGEQQAGEDQLQERANVAHTRGGPHPFLRARHPPPEPHVRDHGEECTKEQGKQCTPPQCFPGKKTKSDADDHELEYCSWQLIVESANVTRPRIVEAAPHLFHERAIPKEKQAPVDVPGVRANNAGNHESDDHSAIEPGRAG